MFSEFFIHRPIFATVLALIIVIAGSVSMSVLPVSQYPTITPVQIQVTTTYPGADAKTVAESVAAPIEAQINGVDNMLYMTSTSSNTGQTTITVYFTLDTDPDMAQVLVQNRVSLANPDLPDAVKQYGVTVQKQSSTTLMLIAVYDKDGRYSPDYVTTYTNVYILEAIKRVNGAGQAQIFGIPDQAMRIWMNPDRMASLKITTTDIKEAIANQNALYGAGQVGQEPSAPTTQLTFPVITQQPYIKPKEYENIILRADNNGSAIVRVGDVARAAVGRKQYIDTTLMNQIPINAIAVYQQPGANGLQVSTDVRAMMKELKKMMPEGIDYMIALDTTDFVRISIEEVIETLVIAVLLVVLVVYLFLQDLRATFICTTAILVAIIGTFSGLYALGFSVNLLTLFAIVLAIGMVVDDAIVVVENVERHMAEEKLPGKEAAVKAMQEVSGPVVAVVLCLSAVFLPAAFLPGTTGQLYKQFALTIIISVTISGFIALTLTPAMCGVILKTSKRATRGPFAWFNNAFEKLTDSYGRLIKVVIRKMALPLLLFIFMISGIIYFFKEIPTAFVPNEDQGYVFAQVIMPDATSLQRTAETTAKISKLFTDNPAVETSTVVNGFSLLDGQYRANMATFFVTMQDFSKRYASIETAKKENVKAVLESVYAQSQDINTGAFIPIPPPAIPGIGKASGFEFWIQNLGSGDAEQLFEVMQDFLAKAHGDPTLTGLNSTFRASGLQLTADVNRDLTVLLNVPIADVYNTLQAQFGSIQVSQYEQYSRVWDVILQSDSHFREDPSDITRLYTRSNNDKMIPLSAMVTPRYSVGPSLVTHFNGVPAVQITGNAAKGYSSGQAIAAMQKIADEVLPQGYSYSWAGMALQEKSSGASSTIAFAFGLLVIFLILAALYESWSLPLSVISAVPFGVIGALIAIWLRGLNNDVYFQIGLLVLVGLAAKNAILIVEFAVELRDKGKAILDCAVDAGTLRLRPIIMTSLAFILGVFPLFIAMGAGANARHSIGTGIIGGMLAASSLALLYVPLFYVIIFRISDKLRGHRDE
ncbi:MAG: multidrug efflux RND transporter permease subunit [Chlamydiales bacterium]|nr:multidrug efflux RND transporter permease subunit [Chlamydiia bacterium]MCP5508603.1 multidrug efflux RND transporter permease subunit [Chlamydiales bacterium]